MIPILGLKKQDLGLNLELSLPPAHLHPSASLGWNLEGTERTGRPVGPGDWAAER